MKNNFLVSPSNLRLNIDSNSIPKLTEKISQEEIISQEKPLNALKLGLNIRTRGYNLFVTGLTGLDRITILKNLISKLKPKNFPKEDKCYVNNFEDSSKPILLTFPKNKGSKFRDAIENLIDEFRKEFLKLLESKAYVQRRKKVIENYEKLKLELFQGLREFVNSKNFEMIGDVNFEENVIIDSINYVFEEKNYDLEQLTKLKNSKGISAKELKQIFNDYFLIKSELDLMIRKLKLINQEMFEEIEKIEKSLSQKLIAKLITKVKKNFSKGDEKIENYLKSLKESILENVNIFHERNDSNPLKNSYEILCQYDVNLIDSSENSDTSTVVENFPTFTNLFGDIESLNDFSKDSETQDFRKIRGGSIIFSDGGFLILDGKDLWDDSLVWKHLKRVLTSGKLEVQNYNSFSQSYSASLQPEEIDLNLKVILVGDEETYEALSELDDDFQNLFKIKVEFDYESELTDKNLQKFVAFAQNLCETEKLLPLTQKALSKMLEYGVRLAGNQKKISTHFDEIANLIRESSYFAESKNLKEVCEVEIQEAILHKLSRHSLIEDKYQKAIFDRTVLLQTQGEKVGQINALTVLDYTDHTFGIPIRISATSSIGNSGVVNIERESDLSGQIHDKGVFILTGFLRNTFAQKRPLNISASICFEQAYSGIDGDSASLAELYALLSSLAEVPLKQNLAVTGSVNQFGEVQSVGGINEKIEGFFEICKGKDFTGNQGVVIPQTNISDLMLNEEVVEQSKNGNFSVFAVSNVAEGLELLTGAEAKVIYQKIDEKLLVYAEAVKNWAK
ncbi:MAG: ATP-binding protein [Calditrichaeota bacterium]|nr:MAG: ATP-binding protein [Calditrichota bacterium]